MPNKCGVAKCTGNYNESNKCRVFKLPKDEVERQKWIAVLPPRENFVVDAAKFYICERHWPSDNEMVKIPGGSTRPTQPPSIFDVPISCLPTPKPPPRPSKQEDKQLQHFLKKDKITSFTDFVPEKELRKYDNILISRTDDRFVCLFMSKDFTKCESTIIVENKATLCSPLILTAYKKEIRVPLGQILHPNNGLSSYSQFHEAVNTVRNYVIPTVDRILEMAAVLEQLEFQDSKQQKKMEFITHQLKLLCEKRYSTQDYCFAVESFPNCSFEFLREYLMMPNKRKVQAVISSVNLDGVLLKTFQKINKPQQKNALLLVDEVKIRPTLAFSGGALSGMAANEPDSKATSMLCIMMKCIHRGPSVMVSVTPVHKLTAAFQFQKVRQAAAVVEEAGGNVVGSITDNHKINQHYCRLFDRPTDSKCPATAIHPLDETRKWYLLFDTVHLLKCIRNNWISGIKKN